MLLLDGWCRELHFISNLAPGRFDSQRQQTRWLYLLSLGANLGVESGEYNDTLYGHLVAAAPTTSFGIFKHCCANFDYPAGSDCPGGLLCMVD